MQGEAHMQQLQKDLIQQQSPRAAKKKKSPRAAKKKKHRQIWLLMRALLLASEGPVSRPHLAEISVFLFLCFSPLFLYGHQSHHESPILMT